MTAKIVPINGRRKTYTVVFQLRCSDNPTVEEIKQMVRDMVWTEGDRAGEPVLLHKNRVEVFAP